MTSSVSLSLSLTVDAALSACPVVMVGSRSLMELLPDGWDGKKDNWGENGDREEGKDML